MDNLIVSFKLDLIRHRRRSAPRGRKRLRKGRFPMATFLHWKPPPKREMERIARILGVRGYQTWKA